MGLGQACTARLGVGGGCDRRQEASGLHIVIMCCGARIDGGSAPCLLNHYGTTATTGPCKRNSGGDWFRQQPTIYQLAHDRIL
eukprot:4448075-Pyramimonas_sp.AAC.1